VKSPPRVTNNTSSLIDVMKINNLNCENTTEILDLGNSGNLEQILHTNVDNPKTRPVIVSKRHSQKRAHKNLSTCCIMNYGKISFYVMM